MRLDSILNATRQTRRDVSRAVPAERLAPSVNLRLASTAELEQLQAAMVAEDQTTVDEIVGLLNERMLANAPAHPDAADHPAARPALAVADVERAQRRLEHPERFTDCAGVEIELAFDPSPESDDERDTPKAAGRVFGQLSNGTTSPSNEAQARELAPVLEEPEPEAEPVIPWENAPSSPKPKPALAGPTSWQSPPDPRSWAAFKRRGEGVSAIDITEYVF